ncbi:hypothetical protein E2C01_090869 [Portunus trituberculatus]|uniref:Uncharacterized protein n=1 Tax=Portunus trituberculatus TaxID=210409 RepID=A0A5B7JLH3_PORTR|nr:hypothetical protein [Portunus trituberculatus]
MWVFHRNLWVKGHTFLGTSYLKAHPLGNRSPSDEAQPTLGPWTGFELMCLETPRTPKHAWFHCTTVALKATHCGSMLLPVKI